ncbi:MAG: proline racemase family protein [Planctomycetes bacterium]|nr:proline racemase family protein [Planctomycetota bacterium]
MQFIDSHTAGEPTRVIVAGAPDLGAGPIRDRLARLRAQDWFRQSVILEPRGSDAVVGAVLCEPHEPGCAAGVIFINNTGYLGMCGHGAIGLAVTLHHLGRIGLGRHAFDTPVGVVQVDVLGPNLVAIENVASYRLRQRVEITVEGLGRVVGDVAWGGNWFFLIESSPFPLGLVNVKELTEAADKVRRALWDQGVTGTEGAEIDHVEFFGPAQTADAQSRNFVYCPGGAYDRSPCGTGTSAKVACLAADGKLKPGEIWVQESVIGSRFTASYRLDPSGKVIPRIEGAAYVCTEGWLLRQDNDPFRNGIVPG